MKHLLIKYISRKNKQVAPNFTYLTYGDGSRGGEIRNTLQPVHLFSFILLTNKKNITAYFYVEKILTKENNGAEINVY